MSQPYLSPVAVITALMRELIIAIDHDKTYSIEEVESHIEEKDLIPWLKKEMVSLPLFDLSLLNHPQDIAYLHDQYEAFLEAYKGEERRKWGVEHNGLCLLMGWALDMLRNLPGVR